MQIPRNSLIVVRPIRPIPGTTNSWEFANNPGNRTLRDERKRFPGILAQSREQSSRVRIPRNSRTIPGTKQHAWTDSQEFSHNPGNKAATDSHEWTANPGNTAASTYDSHQLTPKNREQPCIVHARTRVRTSSVVHAWNEWGGRQS